GILFSTLRPPRPPPLCPYATLFRSRLAGAHIAAVLQVMSPGFSVLFGVAFLGEAVVPAQGIGLMLVFGGVLLTMSSPAHQAPVGDRKSTRLNSSHVKSSYAVFCFIK